MNKLKQEIQKSDSKNTIPANSKINSCVENQLSKIYKPKENCFFCLSCQLNINQKNIYNHLFEPLHIIKLQEGFIKINGSKLNKREKIFKKIDTKNQISQVQQIKKEQKSKADIKNQIILIPSIDNEIHKNGNKNFIEKFIETFQLDLKLVGNIQLSLIVSILVKSYCTITEIIEMKYSQIIDRCTVYYLNVNDSWEKNYLILKERFPDFLQEFISKNAGSNKPLIKLLGKNKRQTLSQELWLSCSKIQRQTKDEEYISFLKGLTLKKLKKITIERMFKRKKIQIANLQPQEEIKQKNQDYQKDKDISKFEQNKNLEKKQVIRIIISKKQSDNQKQELAN